MSKSFIRSMVMLLVLGVIVAAVGLAMGGSTSIMWDSSGPRAMRDELKSLDVTEQLKFAELHVDASVADVRVVSGDAFGIKAAYTDGNEPGYSLDGDVLRVFDSGIGNGGLQIHAGFSMSGPNTMMITLPRGCNLVRAEISVDVGEMLLDGFSADALKAINSTGKISMKDISCGELEATASVGSISLDGVLTARRMAATSGAGSVKGNGSFGGDVSMTADVGSIDIAVKMARDQYMLDAKANIGSVTISPATPNPASAPNTMRLRSGAGSVRAKFEP